jgi:hypothetical protein
LVALALWKQTGNRGYFESALIELTNQAGQSKAMPFTFLSLCARQGWVEDDEFRWLVARTLAVTQEESTDDVPPRDSSLSPETRQEAARRLGAYIQSCDVNLEQLCAIECIQYLGSDAVSLIPMLRGRLQFDDYLTGEAVIDSLGSIGLGAKEILPELEPYLRHTSARVRLSAAKAIWKIGGEIEAVTPVLVEALVGASLCARHRAAQYLQEIGPDALCLLSQERQQAVEQAAALDAPYWTQHWSAF